MLQRSDQIGELVGALAKARKAFKPVLKRSTNPYFNSRYADLAELLAASADALSDNGLVVIQSPEYMTEESCVLIETTLAHSSGQWCANILKLPVSKADAQGIGSATTYGRRYAYGAVLNIASEEDDDGSAATGKAQADRHSTTTDKSEKKGRTINDAQLRALWAAFKSSGKTENQLRVRMQAKYGVEHTKDILKKDLDEIMKWIVSGPPADMTEDLQTSVDAVRKQKTREPGEDDSELVSPPLAFVKLDFK